MWQVLTNNNLISLQLGEKELSLSSSTKCADAYERDTHRRNAMFSADNLWFVQLYYWVLWNEIPHDEILKRQVSAYVLYNVI